MKVLQIFPKKSEAFLKKYKDEHGVSYRPTFNDNIPKYLLVDDELKPITTDKITFNEESKKTHTEPVSKYYTQTQIMNMVKHGNRIDIITEKVIDKMKAEKAEFIATISNAKIEAVEDYKKAHKAEIENAKKAAVDEYKNSLKK